MGLGKWGIIGIVLYLCRNIISNILYILFWGLVAFICYAIVYWL